MLKKLNKQIASLVEKYVYILFFAKYFHIQSWKILIYLKY